MIVLSHLPKTTLTAEDNAIWAKLCVRNDVLWRVLVDSSAHADRVSYAKYLQIERSRLLSAPLRPVGYPNYCFVYTLMRGLLRDCGDIIAASNL